MINYKCSLNYFLQLSINILKISKIILFYFILFQKDEKKAR